MCIYLFFLLANFLSLASALNFTNPLKPENGADPFMVYVGGYYYLLNTASHGHIRMIRATTLEGLKSGATKDIWSDSTPSRCCNLWAPEIHEINGTWHMYYTASPNNSSNQRPYVLKGGTTPWDDYTFLGQLSTDWGIDGSIIQFQNWGHHFIWSCIRDSGVPDSVKTFQSICIAPLTSPSTIGSNSVISSPTNNWERYGRPVDEGPQALYHANKTYMTFSASLCDTQYYSLGLLTWTGEDPMNPESWAKTGPVLSSANGNLGTGHNGFFNSPDGTETWNVFHAENQYPQGSCGEVRYTMAERVYFDNASGLPVFEKAMNLSMQQKGPSGEDNASVPGPSHTPPNSGSSTLTEFTPCYQAKAGLLLALFTALMHNL